jgi:DNA phosphorothioation-associated putative methyltransferase
VARAARGSAGKRVGGFLYVHRDALATAGERVADTVGRATASNPGLEWNVAKVGDSPATAGKLSLLLYEDFSSSAFPALRRAATLDQVNGSFLVTDYSARNNPPILHRKEALLAPDDPRIPAFRAITARAEERGLFRDTKTIGTRRAWERLLKEAGLRTQGGLLLDEFQEAVTVSREKTAMARSGLSQPVGLMVRYGMLGRDSELFDYGCGRGDDVSTLLANGYAAFGWDPSFRPNGQRRRADVVNLGFVINVIEDPHEREETVRSAWSYAERGMAVSVMVQGKYRVDGLRQHGDGYLSRKKTFQKYFFQDELIALVSSVTGELPVSLSPGIVAVFRDKELEQQVLLRKRSRATLLAQISVPPRVPRAPTAKKGEPIVVIAAEELEAICRMAMDLGRLPAEEEMDASVLASLSSKKISPSRALAACVQELIDPAQMKLAADARREDLLVHFALSLFPGAPAYGSLPGSIQRHVRTLFGSHSAVMEAARGSLLALRDPDHVKDAFARAAASGFASFDAGRLRFSADSLEQLPVPVRILAGCADIVHQGFTSLDLIEIGPGNGMLCGILCEGLDRALPRILTTVEVDLTRSRSRVRKHEGKVLYLKSRYLHRGHPSLAKQAAVDKRLLELGIVDEDGCGPSSAKFAALLAAKKTP